MTTRKQGKRGIECVHHMRRHCGYYPLDTRVEESRTDCNRVTERVHPSWNRTPPQFLTPSPITEPPSPPTPCSPTACTYTNHTPNEQRTLATPGFSTISTSSSYSSSSDFNCSKTQRQQPPAPAPTPTHIHQLTSSGIVTGLVGGDVARVEGSAGEPGVPVERDDGVADIMVMVFGVFVCVRSSSSGSASFFSTSTF